LIVIRRRCRRSLPSSPRSRHAVISDAAARWVRSARTCASR
jgi:hypothetical protein